MKAYLFPVIILITLIQNSFDLISILNGGNLALHTYSGPIFIKLLKDFLFVFIIFSVVINGFYVRKSILTDSSSFIFLIVIILFLLSVYFNGAYIAVLGIRWFIPLLVFLIFGDWLCNLEKSKIIFWVYVGLYLCLFAQIVQLFIMPPVYGYIFASIPARTPGIFMAPNSTAFFGCASAALISSASRGNRNHSIYASFISLCISLLAQSGTGIIVSSLLILFVLTEGRAVLRYLIIPFSFVVGFMSLNVITQRDNYLELSGGGRIDVLVDIVESSVYQNFGLSGFGIFTNAANLSSDNPELMIAPDSLVASMIGNFGLFFILILFLILRYYIEYIYKRKVESSCYISGLIVFFLFSFTTIVFEAFPMNIYLAIALLLTNSKSDILPRGN